MKIDEGVALARLTTIGTGGPARAFASPETLSELNQALAWAAERDLPVATVGLGSNLLAADAGVDALVLRLAGGSSSSPTYQSIELPSNSLVRDHWYNLVFHFVWHTDSSIGRAEWWVDGTQVVSTHFPTLYTNPDGRSSYNTCDLVNYHWVAPWTSEVDFDDVAIGPSRASVGG